MAAAFSLRTLGAIAVAALVSVPAMACRDPASQTPYLHKSLDTVGEAEFIAEVEVLTRTTSLKDVRIFARVVSVLRGSHTAANVTITPQVVTSCDGFPGMGERGIIAGKISAVSDQNIVLDPVRAPPARRGE